MMDYRINQQERNALKGLPHLPRLTYLEAIRPYMDYSTGIVGIKRGISYQSLREELYVETQRGKTGGSPSKQQMRRVVKALERAGLVSIQSEVKRLVLKCELATWDFSDQNLSGTRPTHEGNTRAAPKNILNTQRYEIQNVEADIAKNALPATPPVSGINNIIFCFENAFEKFWQMYPIKNGREKTWEIFKDLSLTEELFQTILNALEKQCMHRKTEKANGHWTPNWKNPNNWLSQKTWLDEIPETQNTISRGENNHAHSRQYSKAPIPGNLLWDSCKKGFYEQSIEKHSKNSGRTESKQDITKVIRINGWKQRAH